MENEEEIIYEIDSNTHLLHEEDISIKEPIMDIVTKNVVDADESYKTQPNEDVPTQRKRNVVMTMLVLLFIMALIIILYGIFKAISNFMFGNGKLLVK